MLFSLTMKLVLCSNYKTRDIFDCGTPDGSSIVCWHMSCDSIHDGSITHNFLPAFIIFLISFAISSGERIKSMHPLFIALSGISG